MLPINSTQSRISKIFPSRILKNLLLMSTGGVLAIILLSLVEIWQTGNRIINTIEAFLSPVATTPQIQDFNLIINQIKAINELTTSVFVMESVVPTFQERKLGNFVIGKTQLLYIAHGQVRAGIDLESLKSEHIKVNHNTLQIQLPPVKILDSKIDINHSRVYDYDRGFLSLGPDVAPQLQTLAQQETLKKIVTTACNQGILEEAGTKAKLAITQLFTMAGYEKVEINLTPPQVQDCQP